MMEEDGAAEEGEEAEEEGEKEKKKENIYGDLWRFLSLFFGEGPRAGMQRRQEAEEEYEYTS